MVRYVSALGAVVAIQGAAAKTRYVPYTQYPPPDACHPSGAVTYETTWPPCLSQGEVEGLCAPPTEDEAGWTFQRDCMCKGSFFDDAIGCGKCKKSNALQGHEETRQWDAIFASIQAKYCTDAAPTSNFAGYWDSAIRTHGEPKPMEGDQRTRTLAAGDVRVENYYTAPKPQGPGLPRPSDSSPSPAGPKDETEKNGTQTAAVVRPNNVVLRAAATARASVAVVTGLPAAPAGPKFVMNVTAEAKAEAVVTFCLASMNCEATYVNGFVLPSCDAMKLIPGSEAMVPPAAREGAVDLSRCACATEFLAPKKLSPAPQVAVSAKAEAKASASVTVNVFSPQECQGPCSAPPADAPAQPKEDCDECVPEEKESPAVAPKGKDAGVPGEPADKSAPETAAKASAKDVTPAADVEAHAEAHAEAQADVKASPAGKIANGTVAPPAKHVAPAAGGAVPSAPASPNSRPLTAGAASTYGSAAVMAVAFAVFAL